MSSRKMEKSRKRNREIDDKFDNLSSQKLTKSTKKSTPNQPLQKDNRNDLWEYASKPIESSEPVLESEQSQTLEEIDDSSRKKRGVRTYLAPLSTRSWQPLPETVHQELSTLLELLTPPDLEQLDTRYKETFTKTIVRPLSERFRKIYLPPINKQQTRIRRLRVNKEFNLTEVHQEHSRLNSSYDINSKQLETLVMQLAKEKESIVVEKRYLRQLKHKMKKWKEFKEKRMERLESELGEEFKEISKTLKDDRNSGLNGADDVDMIKEDNLDEESIRLDVINSVMSEDSQNALKNLKNYLDSKNASDEDVVKFEQSLQQLYNLLKL